jgi:sigma-B regulation protein RsbU (phosphoserine phosphatase)
VSQGRLLRHRFPALAGELKGVRHAVEGVLLACVPDEAVRRDLVLAIDEACQNVIRHAYGPERSGDAELTIDREADALVFRLTDWAPRTNPTQVHPRDLDDVRPGGLGTHLIREVMDRVEFIDPPPGCGNLLRMVKRIAH